MTTDENVSTGGLETEGTETERIVTMSVKSIEAENISASMSAIASAKTDSLEATASAIGLAHVTGDASIRLSSAPLVYTKGDLSFHQSYGSAFIAGQNVSVKQAGAAMSIAKTISFEQAGTGVVLASNVSVRKGFVGLLLSNKADISEDSRVLLTGKSVLYIAAALLGGAGLIALAVVYAGSQMRTWRPNISLPKRRH